MGYICKASMKKAHQKAAAVPHDILHRLNRAEGQIRALKKLAASPHQVDCEAFVTQLKAARGALKAAGEMFVTRYIEECRALPQKERARHIAKAISLITD